MVVLLSLPAYSKKEVCTYFSFKSNESFYALKFYRESGVHFLKVDAMKFIKQGIYKNTYIKEGIFKNLSFRKIEK